MTATLQGRVSPQCIDDEVTAKIIPAQCGRPKNHFAPFSLLIYQMIRQRFECASSQHRDSYLVGVLSAGRRICGKSSGKQREKRAVVSRSGVHGRKGSVKVFNFMFGIGERHQRPRRNMPAVWKREKYQRWVIGRKSTSCGKNNYTSASIQFGCPENQATFTANLN